MFPWLLPRMRLKIGRRVLPIRCRTCILQRGVGHPGQDGHRPGPKRSLTCYFLPFDLPHEAWVSVGLRTRYAKTDDGAHIAYEVEGG